jgi:hypothetical protein
MDIALRPLAPARMADFYSVLEVGSEESATCFCTAYHGRNWDEPDGGRAARKQLEERQVSDGCLLYLDDEVAGWCQCGPWESFGLFAKGPAPEPHT